MDNKKNNTVTSDDNSVRGEDIISGRNPVVEALRSGRNIESILVAKGEKNGSIGVIISKAKDKGIPIKEVDSKKLDILGGKNNQGIVAIASVKEYATIDDIFNLAKERNEEPFIIILDNIEDPHNLGAILRTAECTGVHGIIIPKRRAVGLTYSVGKSSAGAVEYVPVARVTNLSAAIDELKERGVWIYGADMKGQCWCQNNLRGSIALVIGSEGEGIGRLIKEKCDIMLSLPMKGKINSLNASVSAGILMYEIARQRAGIDAV